jgi:DNA-binding beta-propeller fold protein YncE
MATLNGINFMRTTTSRYMAVASALSSLATLGAVWAQAPTTVPTYAVIRHIAGGQAEGLFDYASIDAENHRLYLAQQGVTVVDLNSGKVTAHLVAAQMTHGVIPIGGGVVAVAISSKHSVELFNGVTGAVVAEIPTSAASATGWHDPDALLLEPKSGLLIAVNGDSGTLVLIDPTKKTVVDTIQLHGKLEFAAADGTGRVYVNEATTKKVAYVDVALRKVTKEVPLKACDEPSGIAYDAEDGMVISVCGGNGVAKFISAATGKNIASIRVSKGADAVLFDEARHVAFFPGGDDGRLSVVSVRGDIKVIQTLKTMPFARLGALDPATGNVYLPIAKFGPPAPPVKRPGFPEFPGMIPGTFEFLVVGQSAVTMEK